VKEPPPAASRCRSKSLVEEVRETLGLSPESQVRWIASVERGCMSTADPDQLFRVILNLARNALQALESRARTNPRATICALPAGAKARSR